MRGVALLLVLAACGCASQPVATAIPFPERVGAFERIENLAHGRGAVTVGYQLVTPQGGVAATVQRRTIRRSTSLVPQLDIGQPEQTADMIVDAEINRSLAQVRRFYPDASSGEVQKMLLQREGRLHPMRQSVISFRDDSSGEILPMQMDVYVVCCTTRGEVVEYRFRHTPDVSAAFKQNEFVRGFPWDRGDLPQE